jgi:hypothetical protein
MEAKDMSRRIPGPWRRDSAHIRRTAEAQALAHERAVQEHLSLSPRERMEQAMRVSRDVKVLERWGRNHDRPWELHERARALGISDE